MLKIRTEINLHPLVQHDVHGIFFYIYTTLGTFFLTCPARTSLKYCKNIYKLRAKFPLRH